MEEQGLQCPLLHRVTGKGNATAELTEGGSGLVLCHSNLVRKPQLLPWKNTARKDSPYSRSCPLREVTGALDREPWEKAPFPPARVTYRSLGKLKWSMMNTQMHTHVCAHCYVSYRWDYNSVTLVTTLLEMPQHPLLGTAGICHSKATCICTACPRALVCSISAKALQGESWAIRTQPPEMPFLRDGGKQRKAFPF